MIYPPVIMQTYFMVSIGGLLVYLPESIRRSKISPKIRVYAEKSYHDYILNKHTIKKSAFQKKAEVYNRKFKLTKV